jgi:hypothetical protein
MKIGLLSSCTISNPFHEQDHLQCAVELTVCLTPDGATSFTCRKAAAPIPSGDRANGGEPQKLIEDKDCLLPYSISPDGRRLAYSVCTDHEVELRTLPLDLGDPDRPKPGKPELLLAPTKATQVNPAFSPDGRWIAYRSNESHL